MLRRDEPGWWYGPEAGLACRLLMPAACVWGYVAERRWTTTQPFRAERPVICIGNFTAGGTGKTPLALHMAGVVERQGRTPIYLTRGYGGRLKGPHWVVPGEDTAADTGDEPLLLARRAPVMLAGDRAAGARAIVSAGRPDDVIVMDDGLQNPAVVKNFSIAVVDGARGIGNGRVIPAGPLRAPLVAQLARVDTIVVNQTAAMDAGIAAQAVATRFKSLFSGPVFVARTLVVGDTAWLQEKPMLAYAAIGSPERFFRTLRSVGANVVREIAFPDHHPFSETEAATLLQAARTAGAQLVTTEKDWVRLTARTGAVGAGAVAQLKSASRSLPIAMVFDEPDAGRLEMLIAAALTRHAPASPP